MAARRRRRAAGAGLVEIGQADLTALAVVVRQQPIHGGMRGIGGQDQVRPVDRFLFVAMGHQPLRRRSAERGVERRLDQLPADPVEFRAVLADAVERLALGVGIGLLAELRQDQHPLIAVGAVERVDLHGPIDVFERRLEPAGPDIDGGSRSQHRGIPGCQGQGLVQPASGFPKVPGFEGILPGPEIPQRIVGLAGHVPSVLLGRLGVAVDGAEHVGQAQPGLIEFRVVH